MNVGWTLGAVAASLAWLLPTHAAPWTTVYQELLTAVLALAVALVALRGRGHWSVDALSCGFLLAAFIPLAQAAAGLFQIPSEAPLVSLYLVGFSLSMISARRVEEAAPGRLAETLFAGFVIAAIASTGIALCQWLGVNPVGVLLAPNPPLDRPVANVGQANNLATLLSWGLVGLWWGHARRHIGGWGAGFGAAFLLMGVALTQSRAGALEVMLIGAAAFGFRRRLATADGAKGWIALAAWFLACTLCLGPVTRALTTTASRSLLDAGSPRERTMLLKMVLRAIEQQPLFGYGWNQNVTAHVALAAEFPMHGTVGNAHNLVLDLIMWNGLPLAALLIVASAVFLWRMTRAATSPEQTLLLIALGVLGVHAALELPHVLAFFLIPAALMLGTLSTSTARQPVVAMPRPVAVAILLGVGVVLLMTFNEYGRIERNAINAAMRAAHLRHAPPDSDPRAVWLRSLQDGLATLRTEPRGGMGAPELDHFRRVVTRYPTASGLFRFATSAALNARPDDSRWALTVLCSLHSVEVCAGAADEWAAMAADGKPELRSIRVPAAAGSTPR